MPKTQNNSLDPQTTIARDFDTIIVELQTILFSNDTKVKLKPYQIY